MTTHDATTAKPTILVVDDDPDVLESLSFLLEDHFVVQTASSGAECLEQYPRLHDCSVVVMDIKMPGIGGIEAARQLHEIDPEVLVIFHTAYPGEFSPAQVENSVTSYDYLVKADDPGRLQKTIAHAVDHAELRRSYDRVELGVLQELGLVGRSKALRDLYANIKKAASTNMPLLIYGEPGSGKGVVAKAVHLLSQRADRAFQQHQCSVMSPDSFELAMFGTAPSNNMERHYRPGAFSLANKGTLFLDGIENLDPASQAKLLVPIEELKIQASGTAGWKDVDVRIISSTSNDLRKRVSAGEFRQDLYARICPLTITVPALRDRKEDIEALATHLLGRIHTSDGDRACILAPEALSELIKHDFPNNVRELSHILQLCALDSTDNVITAESVRQVLSRSDGISESPIGFLPLTERLKKCRKQALIEALLAADNNKTRAAELLGITTQTIHEYINKFGLKTGD